MKSIMLYVGKVMAAILSPTSAATKASKTSFLHDFIHKLPTIVINVGRSIIETNIIAKLLIQTPVKWTRITARINLMVIGEFVKPV